MQFVDRFVAREFMPSAHWIQCDVYWNQDHLLPHTAPSLPGGRPSPVNVTVHNGAIWHHFGPHGCSTPFCPQEDSLKKKEPPRWLSVTATFSSPLHLALTSFSQHMATSLLRRRPSITEPSSCLVLHLHISWPCLSASPLSRTQLLYTPLISVFPCQVTEWLAVRCRKIKFHHEENASKFVMDAFYLSDLQIFHLRAPPHLFAFSVIIFTPDSTGKTLLGTIATSTFFSMEYTTLCIEVTESYHGGKFRDHWVQSPYSRDEETTPRNEGICLKSSSKLVAELEAEYGLLTLRVSLHHPLSQRT